MLDMKVTGLTLLTISITYTTTVGNVEACKFTLYIVEQIIDTALSHIAFIVEISTVHRVLLLTNVSVIMAPDADQVKTSI